MGVGCGGFNLNKLVTNKSLNSIGDVFKNNVVGNNRYHVNPTDLLSTTIADANPIGFLTAGGDRGGSVLSQVTAGAATAGQQSYGRLFTRIPKGFSF